MAEWMTGDLSRKVVGSYPGAFKTKETIFSIFLVSPLYQQFLPLTPVITE